MVLHASIVIPVFNRVDLTVNCLASLRRHQAGDDYEVIVVDNGSSDGSAQAVREVWPEAVVVRNAKNLGFARACNQGAARATHDLVVFLNNDTEAHQNWLAPLADALHGDVGLVAPKLLFPDGTLQHAGMYLVEDRAQGLALNGVHRYYRQPADLPAANTRRDCTIVTGAVLAVDRSAFAAVGGFDEDYWNGCEDVELCLAVGSRGLRVVYEPASVLTHHESASGPERWTAVNDNLRRLARRWSHRVTPDLVITEDGSVIPVGAAVTPAELAQAVPAPDRDLTVAMEGSLFGFHSLAQVNRELAVRLTRDHRALVLPRSAEVPDLGPTEDGRLRAVVLNALCRPQPAPAVTIRQQWPPDWSSPQDGSALVVCQPWEFGGLPDAWVEPLLDLADEVWCYTSWVRDCYLRSGIPAERLAVVPIGVDAERFSPVGPRLPLRSQHTTKFLFVGGAVYRKGVDVLLDAYRAAFSADDDVCLVVKTFGASTFYRGINADAALRELAADPAGPAIELIDADLSQEDMAGLYRACDVLVHPYRGEGFGMGIAEAMACGLPVIVTGDGAALDFCDADTAYLIASNRRSVAPGEANLPPSQAGYWLAEPDRTDLVNLLRHVVEHPAEARAKGAAGRARVLSQLNWADIAELARERLGALASRTPRRLDVDADFQAGLAPYPLDEPGAAVVLVDLAQPRDASEPAGERERQLAGLVEALAGVEGATLVVHATAADLEALGPLLEGAAVDVLAIAPALAGRDLARLYCGADAIAPLGNATVARRARRCQRPIVAGSDECAVRTALEPPGRQRAA